MFVSCSRRLGVLTLGVRSTEALPSRLLLVPVAGRRKYCSVCNKMLPPEATYGIAARMLLAKASHMAGQDQFQEGEEVNSTLFPGPGEGIVRQQHFQIMGRNGETAWR